MTHTAQPNALYTGDNLHVLHGINSESVQLIYLDPPFNSKRLYSGTGKAAQATFKDMWTWKDVDEAYLDGLLDYPNLVKFIESIEAIHGKAMMSYITYMTQRLLEMHRILSPTGSLYLHCDPTASHYLKIVCDRIFGQRNFGNEVVWCYKGWTTRANRYQRKHDNIFFYKKTQQATFNIQYREPSEGNKRQMAKGMEVGYYGFNAKQRKVVVCDWDKYHAAVERGELPRGLRAKEMSDKGVPISDWWDIPIIGSHAKERTGYPTQKPLALLERIIATSSDEGDLVLDPFAGSGTTLLAAKRMNRRYIGIDISDDAFRVAW